MGTFLKVWISRFVVHANGSAGLQLGHLFKLSVAMAVSINVWNIWECLLINCHLCKSINVNALQEIYIKNSTCWFLIWVLQRAKLPVPLFFSRLSWTLFKLQLLKIKMFFCTLITKTTFKMFFPGAVRTPAGRPIYAWWEQVALFDSCRSQTGDFAVRYICRIWISCEEGRVKRWRGRVGPLLLLGHSRSVYFSLSWFSVFVLFLLHRGRTEPWMQAL